jgi:molybdate transport system substrate-binding protein
VRRRAFLAAGGALAACAHGGERDTTVVAGSSLRAALPEVIRRYGAQHARQVITVSYGSSGQLERQIEAGAPVDAAVFASAEPVDALVARGLADPSTRRVIAANRVVLAGPKGGPPLTFAALASLPADARIAVGDPAHVPAGKYAEQVLRRLGLWDAVRGKLVLGADVASVVAYVRRGEVVAGIVYASDVHDLKDVALLDEPPAEAQPRVEVVAVAMKGASAEARSFVAFLGAPEARALLTAHGFGPP